ncbi:hypothetical protein AKJ16_DCAP23632 [Drosera capensis]
MNAPRPHDRPNILSIARTTKAIARIAEELTKLTPAALLRSLINFNLRLSRICLEIPSNWFLLTRVKGLASEAKRYPVPVQKGNRTDERTEEEAKKKKM